MVGKVKLLEKFKQTQRENTVVESHRPHWRGEAQHGSLHALRDKRDDVFSQTSVSVQSPEDVECVNL